MTVAMPFISNFSNPGYFKFVVYLAALHGTASFSYSGTLLHAPVVLNTTGPAATLVTSNTTSGFTITCASPSTGYIIFEGY